MTPIKRNFLTSWSMAKVSADRRGYSFEEDKEGIFVEFNFNPSNTISIIDLSPVRFFHS